MKLSEVYTTNTVASRNNGSNIAYIKTDTFDNLFSGDNPTFDTSILFNNGSTHEMLQYGNFAEKMPIMNTGSNNTLTKGSEVHKITYLGCCLVSGWTFGAVLNLSKKKQNNLDGTYSGSWDNVKDCRFIIDFVENDSLPVSQENEYDYLNTTDLKYGFSNVVLQPFFTYHVTPAGTRKSTSNLDELTEDTGKNRVFLVSWEPKLYKNYNKFVSGTTELQYETCGDLVFVFNIDGDIYFIKSPANNPVSDRKTYWFRETSSDPYMRVSIGKFNTDFEDKAVRFAEPSLGVKGAYAYYDSSFRSAYCFYYMLGDDAYYLTNSSGFKWYNGSPFATAKDFTDKVRLGVMSSDGVVKHDEWLVGERAIENSDNPNKNGKYDDIPERTAGDGSESKEDDIADMEYSSIMLGAPSFFNLWDVSYVDLIHLNENMGNVAKWYDYIFDDPDNPNEDVDHKIPKGFDPMKSIIGLMVYPFDLSNVLHSATQNLKIGVWDTGIPATKLKTLTYTMKWTNINIDWDINDPYNFEPYTQIFIYLPWLGEIKLPTSQIVGKTLDINIFLDLVTGSALGCVKASGNLVGQIGGQWGYPMPITSDGASMQAQAITNAKLTSFGSATALAGGITTGNPQALIAGGAGMIGAMQQADIAKASNYCQVKGSSTALTNFFMPNQPYVKVVKSQPCNKDSFEKSNGKYVLKYGKPMSGYNIASNPELNIPSATESEKQHIKAILESGFFA